MGAWLCVGYLESYQIFNNPLTDIGLFLIIIWRHGNSFLTFYRPPASDCVRDLAFDNLFTSHFVEDNPWLTTFNFVVGTWPRGRVGGWAAPSPWGISCCQEVWETAEGGDGTVWRGQKDDYWLNRTSSHAYTENQSVQTTSRGGRKLIIIMW